MNYTLEELKKMMDENDGSLDLRGTQITSLPDNLTVGGSLDLRGTQITSLPDNLTVGGYLYLEGTQITSLPDNLTVGGYLDLRGTQITNRHNYNTLRDGDYKPGKYIYCDNSLNHIKRSRKYGNYTYYYGKIKGRNVISDGTYYAHCKNFKDGVLDLEFKKCKDRGADQYKHLTLDSIISKDDAIVMYRIITGACQQGTQGFVDSVENPKDSYTIKELIEMTRGQYGASTFEGFFKNEK